MAKYPAYLIKKDSKGEFRWTYYAKNGEKIAQASEGYKSKASAEKSISIMKASSDVPSVYEEPAAPKTAAKALSKAAKAPAKTAKTVAKVLKTAVKSAVPKTAAKSTAKKPAAKKPAKAK